ncbi:MAG: bis(5'-nucleosyl)-tetraphosphatase (symmetrical) YqeK [bacterium]|nr:bis(5'-nucleosyl)-tetraphosphatase (symmetrical) YqeK [bacterium]
MENIIDWLKENLSEERFVHSISTAKTAKKLAKEFGEDENKAELAGLLHDCAKEIPYEEMKKIIKEEHLDIDEDEIKAKKVLHAPLSAHLAKKIFDVTDDEILSAIRFHTIGKIGMTTLEKIIYLADKIEPETRVEPYFEELRKELKKTNSLDKTLLLSSQMTIKSLVDRNLPINYKTIEVYNYLLNQ